MIYRNTTRKQVVYRSRKFASIRTVCQFNKTKINEFQLIFVSFSSSMYAAVHVKIASLIGCTFMYDDCVLMIVTKYKC